MSFLCTLESGLQLCLVTHSHMTLALFFLLLHFLAVQIICITHTYYSNCVADSSPSQTVNMDLFLGGAHHTKLYFLWMCQHDGRDCSFNVIFVNMFVAICPFHERLSIRSTCTVNASMKNYTSAVWMFWSCCFFSRFFCFFFFFSVFFFSIFLPAEK